MPNHRDIDAVKSCPSGLVGAGAALRMLRFRMTVPTNASDLLTWEPFHLRACTRGNRTKYIRVIFSNFLRYTR